MGALRLDAAGRLINPGEMTSFNHFVLGAVEDWMHRTIGGIALMAPGYERVLIAPHPWGDLTWARAALETRHGTISTDWSLDGDGRLNLQLDVPDGVEVEVRPTDGTEKVVGSGRHEFAWSR